MDSIPTKPNAFLKVFVQIDKIIEAFAIFLLAFLIINVFAGVVMRYVSGKMFPWSEEISLLCLTWFSFMGIAIGFRENLHLGMDMLDSFFSPKVLKIWDKAIDVIVFSYGAYLVYFGLKFTMNMSGSVLPVTQWPNIIQYVVMPITGVLVVCYSFLHLLGYDMARYNKMAGEEE